MARLKDSKLQSCNIRFSVTGGEIKTYVTREVRAMSDRVGTAYQEPVIEADPDAVWTEMGK